MTFDQWKTRSPNPNDEIEWELEPTELDLVYEDLAAVQSQKEELLAALKLVEPLVKWLGDDQYIAEVAKIAHDAIAKAEGKS